jgi:hypothetical protein
MLNKKKLKNNVLLKSFFVLFIIFLIYIVNKVEYAKGGIGNSVINFLKFEFILISVFSLAILRVMKKNLSSYLLISVFITLIYLSINEFYIYFERTPRVSDLSLISELFQVISTSNVIIILILAFLFLLSFIKLIDFKKGKANFLILFSITLFFSIKVFPKAYIYTFNFIGFNYIEYNIKKSTRDSGYLNHIFFEEAKKELALNELEKLNLKPTSTLNLKFKDSLENIHLIVLESFYDPNMFKNLSFSKNPIHPNFLKIFDTKNVSTSPVYAGNTAQAEFEVLTGAPALSKYGVIEFNLFDNGEIKNSLPAILNDIGYTTIASNSLKPDVFNSFKAYKSLGFNQQYYITGNTYLKKREKDQFIFDGDLLNQNIKFIDSIKKQNPQKPIFNYVLGMYGHSPNSIDTSRNPIEIDVFYEDKLLLDSKFTRSINQIYYRTLALAKYVEKLKSIDPNSLIVIIGDHLPNIPEIKKFGFIDNGFKKTPFYIAKNGNQIPINKSNYRHYDIYRIILNSISHNNLVFSKKNEDRYKEVMFQSIK